MKNTQLRQFTDESEKVTRERDDHPGIEPRQVRRHPAAVPPRTQARTSTRQPHETRR